MTAPLPVNTALPVTMEDGTLKLNYTSQERTMICSGCSEQILPENETVLLLVDNTTWHTRCLRCSTCRTELQDESSCFMKDGSILCYFDYSRYFGEKCQKCDEGFELNDPVRELNDKVFHDRCFTCEVCDRPLEKGKHFGVRGNDLLCLVHAEEESEEESDSDWEDELRQRKKNATRWKHNMMKHKALESIDKEQTDILEFNFQERIRNDETHKPIEVGRIARESKLSETIVRRWFNSRTKAKNFRKAKQLSIQNEEDATPMVRSRFGLRHVQL